MTVAAFDPGLWTFAASAVVALGALGGILVNSRGNRDATRVSAAAQTVEQKAKEFQIISDTLDQVVADQQRAREDNERIRAALAACLTERHIARTNEGRLLAWIRDRFPGERPPDLLEMEDNGGGGVEVFPGE